MDVGKRVTYANEVGHWWDDLLFASLALFAEKKLPGGRNILSSKLWEVTRERQGSGCGTVGRAVASDSSDARFEFRHRQYYSLSTVLKAVLFRQNKVKRSPGIARFKNEIATGQWLWHRWQSGRFRYKRSTVWIPSSAKCFTINCIKSCNHQNKEKRGWDWPNLKTRQRKTALGSGCGPGSGVVLESINELC